MNESTASQSKRIIEHLQTFGKITPLEALRHFGTFRLGARIYDLKKQGFLIHTRIVSRGKKRYAQYELVTV